MIVQHNLPAMNSHRNLGINNKFTSKNLEKLSSGYRINRAADDAAGLAISEKMRGQIRGLSMAEQNTSHGINLIQTAEGGLNETHAILQRMRELAVQSSNGTYQNEDRLQITKEFDALKSEITRVAESTHYNGIKLLNGNLDDSKIANATVTIRDTLQTAAAVVADGGLEIAFGVDAAGTAYSAGDAAAVSRMISGQAFEVNSSMAADGTTNYSMKIAGETYKGELDATTGELKFKVDGSPNDGVLGAHLTFTFTLTTSANAAPTDTIGPADAATYGPDTFERVQTQVTSLHITGTAGQFTEGTDGLEPPTANTDNKISETSFFNTRTTTTVGKMGENLVFQIGANGGDDQRVSLAVKDMAAKALGIVDEDGDLVTGKSILDSSIDTIENANQAIEIITGATNMVSAQRAELGALQNRLEHTMNNLGVTKENLTAAESTIRDVDMAKEMMEFTKNNILVQASQAMLAQANQLPQGVLQLLR